MHKARAFFYVCAGVFVLALSWHLGARSATAQGGATVVGITASSTYLVAVTANGDVYADDGSRLGYSWQHRGNIFSGPVPTPQKSWGELKARYR